MSARPGPAVRVLVVEDEALIAAELMHRLAARGFAPLGPCATEAAALALAHRERPDVVLMDIRLEGGGDGIAAADRIFAELDVPTVFVTANTDEATRLRARTPAQYGFVTKPVVEVELIGAIELALHRHRTEAGFRIAFQGAGIGMALIAPAGTILRSNAAFAGLLRTPAAALRGASLFDFLDGAERGEVRRTLEQLTSSGGDPVQLEVRVLIAGGPPRWATLSFARVARSGALAPVIVQLQDIDERKRLVADLSAVNIRLRRFQAALSTLTMEPPVIAAADGALAAALRRISDTVGIALDVQRVGIWRLAPGGDRLVAADVLAVGTGEHSAGAEVTRAEMPELFEAPGAMFEAMAWAQPSRDPATAAYAARFLAPSGLRAYMRAHVWHGGRAIGMVSVARLDDRPWSVDEEHFLVAVANIVAARFAEDEYVRATQRVQVADKLAALGSFASGIAHDFNNVLMVVRTVAELIAADLPPASGAMLDDMREAIGRATGLTRQLLAFARSTPGAPVLIRPCDVVERLGGVLRRMLRGDIRLEIAAEGGFEQVRIDVVGFEQIVMNLVINARDAMPHGGRIQVSTRSAGPDEVAAVAPDRLALRGAAFAVLRVQDDGEGIPTDVLPRVFDQFFTTKVGAGTGLGLATVQRLAREAGGFATVTSAPGAGATFEVWLPVTAPAADVPVAEAATGRVRRVSGGRILLVDDDALVRDTMVRALRRLGYEVEAHAHGAEVLAALEAAGGAVDLVITDLAMPGMSGSELAVRVRDAWPQVPILVITAHPDDPTIERLAAMNEIGLLLKPVATDHLRGAIDAAIAAAAGPS